MTKGPSARLTMGGMLMELQGIEIRRPYGEVLPGPDAGFFKTLERKSGRFGPASMADDFFVLLVEIDGAPAYRLCCKVILLIPTGEESEAW